LDPTFAAWKPPYPGIDSLQYGKNKEGYWKSADFLQQVDDFVWSIHVITENKYQIILEIDSSSNHLAKKEDGLGVRSLNMGGKQKAMRPSVMTEGCLNFDNDTYPCKLQHGDTQHMQFQECDPPPWYDPTMRKYDLKWADMTADEKRTHAEAKKKDESKVKKAKKDKTAVRANRFHDKEAVATAAVAAAAAATTAVHAEEGPAEEFTIYGYVGKPKGVKQILWERGLWKDLMHASWDNSRRRKAIEKGELIDETLDASQVLLACPDFQNENTLIGDLLDTRNDIALLSPKCHPELAGVGVEYDIGRSKMLFRRKFNDSSTARLYENSMAAIKGVEIEKVRKFARRARDYLHIYRILEQQGIVDDVGVVDLTGKAKLSWAKLEDMRKKRKTHRNIMEIEDKYLKKDLAGTIPDLEGSGKKRNYIAYNGPSPTATTEPKEKRMSAEREEKTLEGAEES
jgi:hypothetical protein